ncbi:hypothetical protein EDB80DRAFT_740174 [Ilyonectria destructans]|nr:hypothetical protein EDB80DRAFT_740174 [Ilyonectria destructans]
MELGSHDQSIYNAASICSNLFGLYLKSRGAAELRHDLAEELRGRFNLWAAYVGAFAAPKASLDARLVAHSDIRVMVLELLVMVQRNIRQELDPNCSIPQSDSENVEPGEPPLLQGLNAVDAALSRLHSLAVAIRRSAARSHRQKLAFSAPSGNNEGLCYTLFVRRRFPHARGSLTEQLGKSVHFRGRSMFYQLRHNKKIAGNREQTETALPENTEQVFEGGGTDNSTAPVARKVQQDIPMSETNASNIDRQDLVHRVKRDKRSFSHISKGSSILESQDDRFVYPKMPSAKIGLMGVSCPLCSEPLELSSLTDKNWRDHVDRDMEPYVCISEECKEPFQFFVHSRDWKDHMQRMHTLDWAQNVHTTAWHCDMDHAHVPEDLNQTDFNEKDDFMQHLSKAHGAALTRSQLLARTRRNRTAKIRESFTCPLCDCRPDDVAAHVREKPYDLLSKHIARHLKALAFLSLSYLDFDGDYSESSGSGNQVVHKDAVGSAKASICDESFDDIPPTVVSGKERRVDDQIFIGPLELKDPVAWPRRLFRDFPERDVTLERFAAAMKKIGNESDTETADTGQVDPGIKDQDGRTPLSLAAINGSEAIVKLRLDTVKLRLDTSKVDPVLQASSNQLAEDAEYAKLNERFGDDYLRLQDVLRVVEFYTRQVSAYVHEFLTYLSSIELVMRFQPGSYPELEAKWVQFNISIRDLEKVSLEEHLSQVRKHVIEPFELVIKAYGNPSLAMKKRQKRRVDFERYEQLKRSGKNARAKLKERVEQYEALNDTLKKELPKLSALTEKVGNICLGNFVNTQANWYAIWKEKMKVVLGEKCPDMPDLKDVVAAFHRDHPYAQEQLANIRILNPAYRGRISQSTTRSTDEAASLKIRPRPLDAESRGRGLSINGDQAPSLPPPDFKRNSGQRS